MEDMFCFLCVTLELFLGEPFILIRFFYLKADRLHAVQFKFDQDLVQ